MKNVKENIINFKDLAKQLEACVRYNSTDIEVMQDIYAECKKDLITLEKLTLEALEKGNAHLFEQLVEASTHVNRSIKLFESFEKDHKERRRSFQDGGWSSQNGAIQVAHDDRDLSKRKKSHEGYKKRDNKRREKKYKSGDDEEEDSERRNRSRSQSMSRSQSGSLSRNSGKRKEHEKRGKKKKKKGKERRTYFQSDEENNSKEKDTNENRKMIKSDSLESFNKAFGTFHDTMNLLSSEMEDDLDDFQIKQKKKEKKKKKKHDGKLKGQHGSANENDSEDLFLSNNHIDSLDDLSPRSSNSTKDKTNKRGKAMSTHGKHHPVVIVIHISDIINVSQNLKTVYIYLTLKSIDKKISIRKKTKSKDVNNFSINVSELFEFSVSHKKELFLYIDVVDKEKKSYCYRCLINLDNKILKKTRLLVPTAFLLTQVSDNSDDKRGNQNLIPTNPIKFSVNHQNSKGENIDMDMKNFSFISPTVNSSPWGSALDRRGQGHQPVDKFPKDDLFAINPTGINRPNNRLNDFPVGRGNPNNLYAMNKNLRNPNLTNFNFARTNQNGPNSNNFNFVSRNVANRNIYNWENGNQGFGTTNFGTHSFGSPSFGGPSFGGPSFGGPSFGGPSFGGQSFRDPSFRDPSFGDPSFAETNRNLSNNSTFNNYNNSPPKVGQTNLDPFALNSTNMAESKKDLSESPQMASPSIRLTKAIEKARSEEEEKKKKNELAKNEKNFSSDCSYVIMSIFLKNKDIDHETELMKQNNLNLYKQLYNVCNKEKVYYENKNKENERKIEELDKAVMLLELDNENYVEANNKLKEIIESNKEIIKVIENIVQKKNNKIEKLEKENERVVEAEKLIEENKKENLFLSEQITKLSTNFEENKMKLKNSDQVNENLNSKVNNLLFQLQNAQMKNEKLLLYLSYLVKHIHKSSCDDEANMLSLMKLKNINWSLEGSQIGKDYPDMLHDITNKCNYVKTPSKYPDIFLNDFIKSNKSINVNPKHLYKILGISNDPKKQILNYSSDNSKGVKNSCTRNLQKGKPMVSGDTYKSATPSDELDASHDDEKDIHIDDFLVKGYKKYITATSSTDINLEHHMAKGREMNHPLGKKKMKEKRNGKSTLKGVPQNERKEKSSPNNVTYMFDQMNWSSDEEAKKKQRHSFDINMKRMDQVDEDEEAISRGGKKKRHLLNDKEKFQTRRILSEMNSSFQMRHHTNDIFHDDFFNHSRDPSDKDTNSTFSFNVKNNANWGDLKKQKKGKKSKNAEGGNNTNETYQMGQPELKEKVKEQRKKQSYALKEGRDRATNGKDKKGLRRDIMDHDDAYHYYDDYDSDFFPLRSRMENKGIKKHSVSNYKKKKRNKLVYNENYTFSNCEMSSDEGSQGVEEGPSKVRSKKEKNIVSDTYLNERGRNRRKQKKKHEEGSPMWKDPLGENELDEEKGPHKDNRHSNRSGRSVKWGKDKDLKHKGFIHLKKKTTNDYMSDYKNFEKKFNYFVKVSKNLQGSLLSNSSDKISYPVKMNKKSYFTNLERIINKCNNKEQTFSYLDSYLRTQIKSMFLSDEDIKKHKNRLRNFYRKNTKGLIFENTLVKIYAKLYYVNEASGKSSGYKKKGLLDSDKHDGTGDTSRVRPCGSTNDACKNDGNIVTMKDGETNRNDCKKGTESKAEKIPKKENIYMNIYVKSILYNIIYIKSDLSENKMDHIKIIKRNLKKNYNKVTEENDYINLKKNEICLLYTLCFKKNHLQKLPLFLNVECLNNDNSTIKLKIALPLPHIFLLKPNSFYLNDFVKNFSGKQKYYYKSYYYNMVDFSTFKDFINSIKLYNSFNVFHFDSYNILYSTYPVNDKCKMLLLIVCDFVKKKNGCSNDTVKLHFVSLSNSLISFSVNLFKQIL
ncbi:conserved Plasmodium protein, unknown function [Plasmodium knowlesi strain H]|uniref:C2 domain-containing protein n=3 Tax=Plasmodium knowlesi TaxID=5850 RepID=A0A5K1VHZ7_PLAKH|nr:conserved Plasmodium protein, unknown function [Plasmodium knowlesi strain H]OTN64883.1 Uncharacterized protein PKNOH_S120155600 [Plasmodium knowlesi]CAA9988412.1 conserved Plasmodium protein, unknown function [Plasmodium knowlesi strain H]SBO19901.1 conserved Plasmodium protein, unknown function [Plasmodium knowlesi strain H]SBO20388.1 conserved Plasmodium protein, unknown function [Plasmodium knowlesi strain H]VVS77886.1 conserved Plasmodium protein, unknown function [Plasmodium knowlesi |eukprot:XP_002259393.1 hypothetical protein, conserved in Plasmodium species [Plasmodium knowlesi strain H]